MYWILLFIAVLLFWYSIWQFLKVRLVNKTVINQTGIKSLIIETVTHNAMSGASRHILSIPTNEFTLGPQGQHDILSRHNNFDRHIDSGRHNHSCRDDTRLDKQKKKTRPPLPPIQLNNLLTDVPTPLKTTDLLLYKVKPATFKVFSSMFAKQRATFTWSNFISAMVDLKFSVSPSGGSAFVFSPPTELASKGPITLHRPHRSQAGARVEKDIGRRIWDRLEERYGWTEEMFEIG